MEGAVGHGDEGGLVGDLRERRWWGRCGAGVGLEGRIHSAPRAFKTKINGVEISYSVEKQYFGTKMIGHLGK